MNNDKNQFIDPLLEKAKIYKLKCEKCKSVSVQITENENPDLLCLECGENCIVI